MAEGPVWANFWASKWVLTEMILCLSTALISVGRFTGALDLSWYQFGSPLL